jgi:hypothetical protein
MVQLQVPKLKIGGFSDFLTSNEFVAVASAVLITPIVLSTVTALISRLPLLRNNFAIGMLVASLIIFIIASMFSQGFMRSVFLGISAGVLLVGIQSTTVAQNLLNRLGGITN